MKKVWVPIVALVISQTKPVYSIEYEKLEPAIKYPGKGWLIQSGNDHGLHFHAYLQSKALMVTSDAIYYHGEELVEGADDPKGYIRWYFRTVCAVPDTPTSEQLGIYFNKGDPKTETFIPFKPNEVSNIVRGWYALWWAVCKNELRNFE